MRRSLLLASTLVLALCTAPAQAATPHVVQPGETLWSIAAANNLYTGALAAYNGLSPNAPAVLGSTIMVPSNAEALPKVNAALASGSISQPCECLDEPKAAAPAAPQQQAASSAAPPPAGAYTVKPGDTFSSLAARAGVQPAQVAGVNGLSIDGPLLAGTTIKLPPASAPVRQSTPAAAPNNVPQAAPAPAPGRVSSSDIHTVAGQHGVDGSLAAAIGWQESGFNNAMVSSANARGVMQVMPGTWDWVQRNLASRKLDPNSAVDNVHAGTLYLRQMLKETGGDPAMAAAGYYQGLGSVRKIGMLPETQRYVQNVMALRGRFGG
jgi:soluble lytic murein transglycosylase-like protein